MRRFQELLISNRRVGAAEAVAMGLVTEVVAADLFERRIGELETLAQGLNRAAVAETRALILASYSNNLTEQLDRESRTLSRRCSSDEMKAALGAMVASRRRPSKPSDEN
jgi:2-(1,2-epoxy-1,2-dihydrophenyl)acetyl-CoA isomerase